MMDKLIVDIDGTLCPIKSSGERYEDMVPYKPMVEALREHQKAGFSIVLFTARNMNSHKESLGRINKMTAPILIEWLQKWDIPFDEILYGKPWPGHNGWYVDDRAVRPDEFLTMTHEELKSLQEKSHMALQALSNQAD